MIDDAPLIKLKKNPPRPGNAQIEALRGTPTGFVVDALYGGGAMDYRIKPSVAGQSDFCGVAVTCQAGPADNLAVLAALPQVRPDDVIVAATDAYYGTAVVGDLVMQMAKNRGAVALVTDGCVRDTPGIAHVGLPCFAAGVTPNSPAKNGPGTVNLPVVVGGVAVEAGDMLVGDVDGVVVIPFAKIDAVIARLDDVRAAEAKTLAAVEGGLGVPGHIEELYKSGRVEEID
ncbi:MAG: RraA family protein [Minwuia sp.]|uniref:RraA family protein n=1 Tax=Minwuia sp. TaxID=2493630 RepID=UPI003A886227